MARNVNIKIIIRNQKFANPLPKRAFPSFLKKIKTNSFRNLIRESEMRKRKITSNN
jgi:hypothetical protein